MQRPLKRLIPSVLLIAAGNGGQEASRPVWQADIQIRTLEVTKTRTNMSARVVVYTENDDDAQNARLLILLPVGVGIERLAPGCAATPGPTMVPSLRAAVNCDIGAIPNHGYREVVLITTVPVSQFPKRFAVFAYSSTPDPIPANNYAERIIP
jgi:hypothetical protein